MCSCDLTLTSIASLSHQLTDDNGMKASQRAIPRTLTLTRWALNDDLQADDTRMY